MCADILTTITLYKNVKITRDYSVVHDMTPVEWMRYLENINGDQAGDPSPPEKVWSSGTVNYYRLPDVIRIEGKYDEIRKATYGSLSYLEGADYHLYFFWVDSVRLIKASTNDTSPRQDVVELTVTPDTWSNKFTDTKLYDSFIVRKHMGRWWRDHSDPDDPDAWVYHPRYFPNAADDVGGAYEPDGDVQDLTEPLDFSSQGFNEPLDLRFIVVNCLDPNGQQRFVIGLSVVSEWYGEEYPVYADYSNGHKFFSLGELMSGTAFTAAGITADYVQSITVTPYMEAIRGAVRYGFAGGVSYLYLDDTYIPFAQSFTVGGSGAVKYIASSNQFWRMQRGMYSRHTEIIDPAAPDFMYDGQDPLLAQYSDDNEPMMFRMPARQRRVVSGMGGTITDIPDIRAFEDTYTCQNLFEMDQALMLVYGGQNVEKANALGNMGTVTAASLPIYNSAWKSYQAIQKAGDDIQYNAQQVQSAVGMVSGTLSGAAMGALTTANPAGAIAGAAGGIAGGVTQMWSNSENLRAKRETIKNSPCTVKSGGSGLAAYMLDYIDVHYMVLKLDDVSLDKLRIQYYYYGYNINAVNPGEVDTAVRRYFDYIETRGARIRGDVNADEAQEIAAAFDRGVRIYHGYDGYKMIGAGMTMENPEREFLED